MMYTKWVYVGSALGDEGKGSMLGFPSETHLREAATAMRHWDEGGVSENCVGGGIHRTKKQGLIGQTPET